MKKNFFAFIMASSSFLCAQSYEHTNMMLDPFYGAKQDNQKHSMLNIEELKSSQSSKGNRQKDVFGSFYTTDDSTVISIIPLNQISFATQGVSLNTDGTILLNKKGKYFVSFGVSAMSETVLPSVILSVNGVGQPGSRIVLSQNGLTSISTIIHVSKETLPATLVLSNISVDPITSLPVPITLVPLLDNNVSAFFTIDQWND